MTLKEFFKAVNGDYDSVIGRLMTEDRVKKFLRMFLLDTSYNDLCAGMESGDYEKAFIAAHTLKGVCSNLGLSSLQICVSDITEALRGNVNNGADLLLPAVIQTYDATVAAISQLLD